MIYVNKKKIVVINEVAHSSQQYATKSRKNMQYFSKIQLKASQKSPMP